MRTLFTIFALLFIGSLLLLITYIRLPAPFEFLPSKDEEPKVWRPGTEMPVEVKG